jgi:hypothetical protein
MLVRLQIMQNVDSNQFLIILPSPKIMDNSNDGLRISNHARCLHLLEVYEDNVTVINDDGSLINSIPKPVKMGNANGGYPCFFSVNNFLFFIIDCDDMTINHVEWVKYYEEHGVSAYFCVVRRRSTEFVFEKCNIPVFSICPAAGRRYFHWKPEERKNRMIEYVNFENNYHSISMYKNKDIPVFFSGSYNHRPVRVRRSEKIMREIPESVIMNIGNLTEQQYIEHMCRAKIAWCPRSAWAEPDHECNGTSPREFEAMALEVLVIRPPIGVIETETRVDGVHYVEVSNDDHDLIDKIKYYLDHDDERKTIARNGRLWWEHNSSCTARAYDLFKKCLSVVKGKS